MSPASRAPCTSRLTIIIGNDKHWTFRYLITYIIYYIGTRTKHNLSAFNMEHNSVYKKTDTRSSIIHVKIFCVINKTRVRGLASARAIIVYVYPYRLILKYPVFFFILCVPF